MWRTGCALVFLMLGGSASLFASGLTLRWTDNSDNEIGFKVERSTDGTSFSQVATVAANVTSYVDLDVASNTDYHYRVQAYNAAGSSDYSNVASAATTAAELLTNGDFGSFEDGTAVGWVAQSAAGVVMTLSEDVGQSGKAQKIEINTANGWGMFFYQKPCLTVGKTYAWTFWYKTDGSPDAQSLTASVTNGPHSAYIFDLDLPGTSGAWQQVEKVFTYNDAQADMVRVAAALPGSYWVSGMSLVEISPVAESNPLPEASDAQGARLINLSSRGLVANANPMIAGFVVGGEGPQTILIRAVGKSLEQFGVTDTVGDPLITVVPGKAGATTIQTDSGWDESTDLDALVAAMVEAGAFALEKGSKDAAILLRLDPGLYTAVVEDSSRKGGTCLVEVYALDDDLQIVSGRLLNLSTRGYVGNGKDVLIAGLVISGQQQQRVLIRGVGPSLAALGVENVVSDPQITVYRSGVSQPLAANDNWSSDSAEAAVITSVSAAVGAFGLSPGSTDAALVVDLNPGLYTVHFSPARGAAGTGLVEVYAAP